VRSGNRGTAILFFLLFLLGIEPTSGFKLYAPNQFTHQLTDEKKILGSVFIFNTLPHVKAILVLSVGSVRAA
jgi:hypothetical protein